VILSSLPPLRLEFGDGSGAFPKVKLISETKEGAERRSQVLNGSAARMR